jgi:very-short-patch-repair endonuclease
MDMAFLAGAPDLPLTEKHERDRRRSHSERSESRSVKVLGARSGVLEVSGTVQERVTMIAGAQRGFVSRGQLLAAGFDSSAIGRLIAKGWLIRAHRGVYAVGHAAPTPLGPATAALLAVRSGAALSHHTAAALWGLLKGGSGDDGLIHITVVGSPGGRPAGACVHRSKLLAAKDIRVHRRLPVISPARALLDIAPTSTGRELERGLDQALIQRLTTVREVSDLLGRCGRHPGRRALEAIVRQYTTTTFTRSQAEERFLALVRQTDLPQPLTNVRRHGYEIDFLWPDQRLAVEIDGYVYHRGHGAFEHDRRKDAALQAAGIRTMRVTWRQLEHEAVGVMARVAQAFGATPR